MTMAKKDDRDKIVKCFLSYATVHKKHAGFFKGKIEQLFRETIQVFVASDPDSIPAGARWYEHILDCLRQADLVFLLLSPTSGTRPWLLFEAGAAVAMKTKIVPLRYSGLAAEEVPAPLADFQSVDLCEATEITRMLKDLATARLPQAFLLKRTAKALATYFQDERTQQTQAVLVGRPLPPLSDRMMLFSMLSETQRRLFYHVETWSRKKGIRESNIREGMPISYYRHGEKGDPALQISKSEYYFRLRELYLIGLLDMKKSRGENVWWVKQEVRNIRDEYKSAYKA